MSEHNMSECVSFGNICPNKCQSTCQNIICQNVCQGKSRIFPVCMSEHLPTYASERMLEHMPVCMPQKRAQCTSQFIPEEMLGYMSKKTSDLMFRKMSARRQKWTLKGGTLHCGLFRQFTSLRMIPCITWRSITHVLKIDLTISLTYSSSAGTKIVCLFCGLPGVNDSCSTS